MLTRRQFIKAGIVGGAALTAAGIFYSRSLKEAPAGAVPQGLTLPGRAIVAAIVPVVLAGALPASGEARRQAVARTVDGVGESGKGHYHGYEGFETFSKKKAVFFQSRLNGIGLFKPPYGKLFERMVRLLLR